MLADMIANDGTFLEHKTVPLIKDDSYNIEKFVKSQFSLVGNEFEIDIINLWDNYYRVNIWEKTPKSNFSDVMIGRSYFISVNKVQGGFTLEIRKK